MKKFAIALVSLPLLWSCGGGGGDDPLVTRENIDDGSNPLVEQDSGQTPGQTDEGTGGTDESGGATNAQSPLASAFCASQTDLQVLSTSFLSAYAVQGNGSDLNYCGGEVLLEENGLEFSISLNDYCVDFRGQQLTVNGDITGAVESGANFTSEIPELTIIGEGVDLEVSGRTWDGRADDMFISLTLINHITGTELILEDISIKKGELDFGYLTFTDLGRFEFKFIEHFNPELTQGQLFIYGNRGIDGEKLILTAENGDITVVYVPVKNDPGDLVDANCPA
jgi:hypothetical protein